MKFKLNDKDLDTFVNACEQACRIANASSTPLLTRVQIEAKDEVVTVKAICDNKKGLFLKTTAFDIDPGLVMMNPPELEKLTKACKGLKCLTVESTDGRTIRYQLSTASFSYQISANQDDFNSLNSSLFNPQSNYTFLTRDSIGLEKVFKMAGNCVDKDGAINFGFDKKEIQVLAKHNGAYCESLFTLSVGNNAPNFTGLLQIDTPILRSLLTFAAGKVLDCAVDLKSMQMRLSHSGGDFTFRVAMSPLQALQNFQMQLDAEPTSQVTFAPVSLTSAISDQSNGNATEMLMSRVDDSYIELHVQSPHVSPSRLNALSTKPFDPARLFFDAVSNAVKSTDIPAEFLEPHLSMDIRDAVNVPGMRTFAFWRGTNNPDGELIQVVSIITEKV